MTQSIKRIWHQTFATGLVDWRLSTIREDDIKAHLTRSQSSGKSGRSTANNEHISLSWYEAGHHHFSRIISRQNPGPIAINTP